MKLKVLLLCLFTLILGVKVSISEYSAQTHYYAVEYLKPTKSTPDISILNVIFNKDLDSQKAEAILREEIARVVSLFPPKGDVMAYAWIETNTSSGSEKIISFEDGSSFLIYSSKKKQMQTENEYNIAKQKPVQPGKGINIDIALELDRGSDGRARVLGKANLPHGMTLTLGLRHSNSNYFAQDKVEVDDEHIVSDWFSDGGKPLPSGTYTIEVSSPLPDFQPSAVKEAIGRRGENLLGPVRTYMGKTKVTLK